MAKVRKWLQVKYIYRCWRLIDCCWSCALRTSSLLTYSIDPSKQNGSSNNNKTENPGSWFKCNCLPIKWHCISAVVISCHSSPGSPHESSKNQSIPWEYFIDSHIYKLHKFSKNLKDHQESWRILGNPIEWSTPWWYETRITWTTNQCCIGLVTDIGF